MRYQSIGCNDAAPRLTYVLTYVLSYVLYYELRYVVREREREREKIKRGGVCSSVLYRVYTERM